MTNALTTTTDQALEAIAQLVEDSLTSPHSKAAYGHAIREFLTWYTSQGRPDLNRALVQKYRTKLQEDGLSPATINQRMSAIRKLANEAADNEYMDATLANGIARVKGIPKEGVRSGNWLTKEQAQALIDEPDTTTLKGKRDRALLAVMLGTGLRRSEVAALQFAHVQLRDNRWCVVDLVGKRNRVRTIPMPAGAKTAIDKWAQAAGISDGAVFRPLRCVAGGTWALIGEKLTPQAVHDLVKEYASKLGFTLAPHDLRRTWSKLARRGGSDMEQIQLSLGHSSILTTQAYLGTDQDLEDAPCDHIGLKFD